MILSVPRETRRVVSRIGNIGAGSADASQSTCLESVDRRGQGTDGKGWAFGRVLLNEDRARAPFGVARSRSLRGFLALTSLFGVVQAILPWRSDLMATGQFRASYVIEDRKAGTA
jgi:hypothetical protein